MTSARLLIGLLLLATVLVDVVVWSVLESREPPSPSASDLVVQAFWWLGICQAGLLALWTSWGTAAAIPWRLFVTTVFISVWVRIDVRFVADTLPIGEVPPDVILAISGLSLWAPTAAVLCIILAGRMGGIALHELPGPNAPSVATDYGRMQFSLGCLMSWLTMSAILLGLFQHTESYRLLTTTLNRQILGRIATFGLCHAVLVVTAAATALGHGGKRYVVLCLVVVGTSAVYTWLIFFVHVWQNALFCLVQLGWLLGSLWVFRVAGYRLVWRGARHECRDY